jgi:hypothetical protein
MPAVKVPFGGDEDQPSEQSKKIGLNKVSTQKSIFESMPKKQTQEEFQQQVEQVQERASSFKVQVAKYAGDFNRAMADKTLPQNKNQFEREIELELLRNMIRIAQEVNAHPLEREGEGSLGWITVLLKTCFNQRDRANFLEYKLATFEKKLAELDAAKKSE